MERNIHRDGHFAQDAASGSGCRLCGGQTFRQVVSTTDWLMESEELFTVYVCSNCGLGETRPILDAEALARHYPQDKYTPYHMPARLNQPRILERVREISGRGLYRHLVQPGVISWLQSNLVNLLPVARWRGSKLPYEEQPGRLLDIGCADGYFLRKAHAEGWTCTGLEMTSGLADALIEQNIAEIHYGRFEDVELDASTNYDVVTMWHVLEHFENPLPVLHKSRDLLAEQGILIVAIPIRSAFEEFVWGKYWGAWDLPRHQSHFNRKAVDRIFEDTGYRIVRLAYEATSNNWIHSFNHWQSAQGRAFRLSKGSLLVQVLLSPLALLLKLTQQSGRVIIYAKRR